MTKIITAIIILVLFAWIVFMTWKSYQVINDIEEAKRTGQILSELSCQSIKEGNNFRTS